MWDRMNPNGFRDLAEFIGVSRAADEQRHFHTNIPMGYGKKAEAAGALYSNCHLWMEKIMEAFGAV
jgi:hypothetical protein